MKTKSVLIALTLATITTIISAKAQDLTPNRTQLQWENWGINIRNLVVSHTVKDETAPNDSLFVCLYLTVKNNDHYGKSFIPQNELKVIIGENNFDAADLDYGLDYIKNIEPTLLRERSCYFEIPKALFKDSFTIRFHSFLSSTEDIQVSITQSKPMPTPVAVATPEFTPESGYKVYHSAEDLKARTRPESTPVPRLVPKTWAPQDRVLILDIQKAINSHDWRTLTAHTDDGSVDYFGRPNTTNDYIRRDMHRMPKPIPVLIVLVIQTP